MLSAADATVSLALEMAFLTESMMVSCPAVELSSKTKVRTGENQNTLKFSRACNKSQAGMRKEEQ